VVKVEESLPEQRLTVLIRWPDGVPCAERGELMPIYDRMVERTWRHLSVMQYRLEQRCATPRCQCQEHGVKAVRVPWAEPGSRFTLHFEAFAEAVIAACRSLPQAANRLGLQWGSVPRLIDSAVARGLARRPTEGDDTLKHTRYLWLQGQTPGRPAGALREVAGNQPTHHQGLD
jgi:hypothetical protein